MNDTRPTCPQCRTYELGHFLNPVQLNLLLRRLSAWREAVVTQVDGQTLALRYPDGHAFSGWHHEDLTGEFHAGQRVHVNPRYHAIAYGMNVLSISFTGARREGDDQNPPRSAQSASGAANLATGRGVLFEPLDEVLTAEAIQPATPGPIRTDPAR